MRRAEASLSNRFRTLQHNAHKQQHAYKRAGTGTWRYECGCGCGGIAAGARCGWRRWYGVQGGYELQERERGGANADGSAGTGMWQHGRGWQHRCGLRRIHELQERNCRCQLQAEKAKQKPIKQKKRPHQTMQAFTFNDGVGGGI